MNVRPIAISLSPNAFPQDVRLAAKLLWQPWRWQQSREEQSGLPGSWLLFDSGRSALFCLLKSFGVGEGHEVLVQGFTCVAVPNPVIWVGAKPVFVDIDKKTLNISLVDFEKKITPQSRVVIVQHTFGLPAPMNEILKIAKKHRLIVIEDCAHALGAKYQGQEVGTLGDAAFFSFGRDKAAGVIAGGAAVSSKIKNQKSKLMGRHAELNSLSRIWIFQQLLHPLLSEVVLSTYGLGIGKLLHRLFLGSGIVARANTPGEKRFAQKPPQVPSKMPYALRLLLKKQIGRLKEFNLRRNEIAQSYQRAGLQSAQPDVKGRVWLRYAMLTENPLKLRWFAKKQNIFLGDWYDQVIAPKEVNLEAVGYRMGMCPAAESVSKQVINLPTYPKMTDQEVASVIAVMSDFELAAQKQRVEN